MNSLDITNEKIRKDLTFNYNGKEYLYSYGKDTLTNNNFTLLYENNKSKDEVLRICDNNITIENENENGKKIYEEYNILNNNIERFDKNELTNEIYNNIVLANSSKIINLPYDYICKSFTDISSQKENCKEDAIEIR